MGIFEFIIAYGNPMILEVELIMKKMIKILFVVVIFAAIVTVNFKVFQQFRVGDRRTSDLHSITPEMIQAIEIYSDDFGKNRIDLPEGNSTTSKVLFAEAMHDLDDYSPNHDKSSQDFFIRMIDSSGHKYEFSVWLKLGIKDTAFMFMVKRSTPEGSIVLKNLGGRKSSAMYRWLEHHKLTE